ncbi:uncharacterized protein [Onthophagus taurus]|uniref:uncharacterized protein n=1 Tax=Onthophagus taurus TaxID=166361 RepID=UPI0039BE07EB
MYKEVVKKWSNIRDSFCKSKKKIKENKKSGSGCVEIKKYIYHDQLQFLNKTIYRRDTPSFPEESQNSDENDDEEIVDRKMERVDIVKQERKRRHSEEFEENMPEILEVQPNRHLSFFQGIIPTLNNFNDDEIVEFQLGVLQLIKKIKQQNTHNFSTVHFLSTQP